MEIAENEMTEFKREYTDDIKRTATAFANGLGGKIYIGIDDGGKVVGVEDPDDVCLKSAASCRNSISPDITMFLDVKPIEMEGKKVVVVTILGGSNKPYYLREKGLKPSGVFIRVGTSTVPISEEHLNVMLHSTARENFLEGLSTNQDLTFKEAKKIFAEKKVPFLHSQFRTLGLTRMDGAYTNLALLLSDQCPYSVKAAIFQGRDKTIFRDRREFGGSIFSQLEETFAYFSHYNRIYAYSEGLDRVEKRDYPPEALREGLLNALIHRDYSFSGPILASLYDDRLEIISIGGVVPGLRMEDIMAGISQSRNGKLAAIFYRLGYVESYGTGIRKMLDCYKDGLQKPILSSTSGSFTLILPNINADHPSPLERKEQEILDFLKEKGYLSRVDIMEGCHLGSTYAYRLLKKLAKDGYIQEKKVGKKTLYKRD